MPQRKGRPTKLYALLARLEHQPGGVRLTLEDSRVLRRKARLKLEDLKDDSPVARREIIRALKTGGAPTQLVLEQQQFLETSLLSPQMKDYLLEAFRVTCSCCGKRFLPPIRQRRRGLRVYCEDCRDDAKREAERERLRQKRAKKRSRI